MKELWTASYVLVVIMIFVTSKKYFNNKHLYKKVSWCMTEEKREVARFSPAYGLSNMISARPI